MVTDDNAYVQYKDQAYEVGTKAFSQIKSQMEAQAGQTPRPATGGFKEGCTQALQQAGASDTSACDISLESWLTNLSNEGTEDVGGAQTIHISRRRERRPDPHGHRQPRRRDPERRQPGLRSLAARRRLEARSRTRRSTSTPAPTTTSCASSTLNLTIDPSQIAGDRNHPDQQHPDLVLGRDRRPERAADDLGARQREADQLELLGDLGVSPGLLGGALGGSLPRSALPGSSGGSSGSGSSGGSGNSAAYLQCLQQASSPSDINACASQL